MTSFLHWRKSTWVLVLWSAYVALWMVTAGSGAPMAAFWWLTGVTVFGSLVSIRPLVQRGRGVLVAPPWTGPRFVDLRQPAAAATASVTGAQRDGDALEP
jgi:hypothetical protein